MLSLLGVVAIYAQDQRLVTQGWYRTLEIVVYPINIDNSPNVERYINQLESDQFGAIDNFIQRESKKFGVVASNPTITRLGQKLSHVPPSPPPPGSSAISSLLWSLKLRWWIWQNAPEESNEKYLVRMFVQYHDPGNISRLLHSVGLQKGLVGVVNAFAVASQRVQNNIIIAHEFLHTVGATDKYDKRGLPTVPDGLGNPKQAPLYPQKKAEVMAGRRAISEDHAEMPSSFRHLIIGSKTAKEIGWLEDV